LSGVAIALIAHDTGYADSRRHFKSDRPRDSNFLALSRRGIDARDQTVRAHVGRGSQMAFSPQPYTKASGTSLSVTQTVACEDLVENLCISQVQDIGVPAPPQSTLPNLAPHEAPAAMNSVKRCSVKHL
jgi:hypothetical protein